MKSKTILVAVASLFILSNVSYAQDVGVADSYIVGENTTWLVGQMTCDPNSPPIQSVDLDFVDDYSELYIDNASGEFMMMIESDSPITELLVTGSGSSGGFIIIINDDPDAPKLPGAGRDTPQHPDSTPLTPDTEDGTYIYVMDVEGTIHILPHENHNHLEVLGGNVMGTGAGEITIENGIVAVYDNLSNRFQFTGASLPLVSHYLELQGPPVADDAETPWDF